MPIAQLAIAQVLALVALCGFADRLIGWGGWGRTKPLVLTSAGLAAWAWWVHLSPVGIATLPLAFLIWRTPGWGVIPGGTINPTTVGEDFGTFARHALAFAFVLPAYWSGLNAIYVSLSLLAFIGAATILAAINGLTLAKHNGVIETVRGLALGLAIGVGYVVLR